MSERLDPALRDIVTIVPREGVAAMIGMHVNPDLAIVARPGAERAAFRYCIPELNGGAHHRVLATLSYLEHLRALAQAADWPVRDDGQILFQLEDNPVDVASVSWECQKGWQQVRLIPDLYYFSAGGYEGFDPALEPWEDRRPSLVWRGSSTGMFWQTAESLDDLPRYRLSKLSAQLGDRADVGLTELCQAASAQDEAQMREKASREGMLKPFVPMDEMARHRFILDIDGNSNSWNFMQKLLLGCCVLRVESRWHQWFADRLIAWEHYVPIAPDLSDFLERAEWCLAHPVECSAIAARGKQFAREMKFADEMARAARIAFADPSGGTDLA